MAHKGGSLLNDEQMGGVLRVAGRPLATADANIHLGISASDVFRPNQNASGTVGASRTTLQLRDRPELRIDQNRLIDTGASLGFRWRQRWHRACGQL